MKEKENKERKKETCREEHSQTPGLSQREILVPRKDADPVYLKDQGSNLVLCVHQA